MCVCACERSAFEGQKRMLGPFGVGNTGGCGGMSVISVPERQRYEDGGFEGSLRYKRFY